MQETPIFVPYAITCVVLSLNLLLLWVSSGAVRAKNKIAINPEDGARYGAPFPKSTRPLLPAPYGPTATPKPQSIHSCCWDWSTFLREGRPGLRSQFSGSSSSPVSLIRYSISEPSNLGERLPSQFPSSQ